MKSKVHPKYDISTIKCACGSAFKIRSSVGDIDVEICSSCHPFFTGQQKLIDLSLIHI